MVTTHIKNVSTLQKLKIMRNTETDPAKQLILDKKIAELQKMVQSSSIK